MKKFKKKLKKEEKQDAFNKNKISKKKYNFKIELK